jgi:cytoskeletal protein RodZ
MGEFGQLLRQLRETHGYTIQSVTQTTRVPVRHLLALESEQFQSLPSDASARGFVRLLAKHYRTDEQELLRRYEQAVTSGSAVPQPLPLAQTNVTIRQVQSGRRHTGLVVGLGVIVVIVLLLGWLRGTQESGVMTASSAPAARSAVKSEKNAAGRVAQETARPAEEEKVTTPPPAPSVPSKPVSVPAVEAQPEPEPKAAPAPEHPPFRLEIEAHEQSWVQAALDGGEMKEALLQPGERLTWTATEQMELTLGNAGGLALSFNGEAVAALGEPGQVVRFHVTKDGLAKVKRSAPPRAPQPQPPPSTMSTPAPSAPSTFAF